MTILIRQAFYGSLLIFIMFAMFGCGNSPIEIAHVQPTKTVIEKDKDAVYYFELGGIIEVNEDSYGRITISMLDYLTSINPENSTYGEHPRITIADQFLTNNLLYYSTNVSYGSGDIENDTTGANITGSKRTDFFFHFTDDSELVVLIKIFSAPKNQNVNSIIASRMLKGYK